MKEELARISEKMGCEASVAMGQAKGQGAVCIWVRWGSEKGAPGRAGHRLRSAGANAPSEILPAAAAGSRARSDETHTSFHPGGRIGGPFCARLL